VEGLARRNLGSGLIKSTVPIPESFWLEDKKRSKTIIVMFTSLLSWREVFHLSIPVTYHI